MTINSNSTPVSSANHEMEKKIFPLKLTSFEKYMICDNSKNCPATFTARMIWNGNIDRDRWNRSFAKALKLHPFFHAFVKKSWGTYYWVLNDQMPQIEWFEDSLAFEAVPVIRFDLRQENGIRVLALAENDQLTFRILIHHSCSDGMGFIHFYNDWFLFYEQDQKETPVKDQPQRDFSLLPKRNDFVFPPVIDKPPFPRLLLEVIIQAIRWIVGRPLCLNYRKNSRHISKKSHSDFSEKMPSNSDSRVLIELDHSGQPIGAHHRKQETDSTTWSVELDGFPLKLREENGHWIKEMPENTAFRQRIVYGKFDQATTQKLRENLNSKQMTVTSFFMARFLNRLADPDSGLVRTDRHSALLRIALPFNLRWPDMELLPISNVVSYCFVNRKIGQCVDSKEFYEGVAQDISRMKRRNVASFFAFGMKLFAMIPGGLFAMIRAPRSLSTAAFSNLGDTDQIFDPKLKREDGKIVLEDIKLNEIWFSGPCRNKTSLFFAMYSYAHELHYAFRYETDKVALNEKFMKVLQLDPDIIPNSENNPAPDSILDPSPDSEDKG